MTSTAPAAPSPSFGLSFSTVLGLLAMLAAAAGWHFAWAQGQEHLRAPLDLSSSEINDLSVELARPGGHEGAREAVRRLKENDGVRGTDLLALLEHGITAGRLTEADTTERRAWTATLWGGRALVWVPAALALMVLLHGSRPLTRVARGCLIAHGLIVLAGAALLVLGASPHARDAFAADPGIVGVGLYGLLGGSVLGLLVGLVGGKRGGIWGALGIALLLLLSAVGSVVAYLKS